MASILVFGGSGIISEEIVAAAIACGHDVTVMNRGRRKARIHPQARCILADLRRDAFTSLREKITGRYDTILDFLSYTTADLTRNMELAKGRCSQYILISSATVYDTKEGPYREEDAIGHSKWRYAVDKAACEHLLWEHARSFGFDYTVIRPYVTYGQTRIPLQYAPLEYYTVFYRISVGKCVPVYGEEVPCTLTTAKDFAVAAVGLIQNQNAFGETYHITGSYVTTWNHALRSEAAAFGLTPEFVKVSERVLRKKHWTRGMDADEVLADKGRAMVFDNSKIRAAVPAFGGHATLEESLPAIVAYFRGSPEARKVNYAWDARVDRLLLHTASLTAAQRARLRFIPDEGAGKRERLQYLVNRYEPLFQLNRVLHTLRVLLGKGSLDGGKAGSTTRTGKGWI